MAETLLLLSGRTTLLEPTLTEGQVTELSLNPDGRLRVASKQGWFPSQTMALTTAAQTFPVDVTDASNVVLHMKNTGSAAMAAGAFVFEGSLDSTDGLDGTWFVVQAVRSDSNTIETGRATSSLAAGAGQLYAWELSVNAIRWFRVRCSTTLTASAIAMWTAIRGSYATEPIPAMQAHNVTFTNASIGVTPTGGTKYAYTSLASTNAVLITAGGSKNIQSITLFNPTAALIYFKMYDKSTAPTVGTDIPWFTIPVPVNGFVAYEFGPLGHRNASGFAFAMTAGPLATDTAAIAVGVQFGMTYT